MSARILALDTATEACSAALLNQQQIDARFEIAPRDHTQRILPLVQELLQMQQLELTALDVLAFGRGPGSFTGVRIGIGIAQGLALGANLPMIGVSSLATLAQGAWRLTGAERVLAAIDARMGEVYWAEYQRDANGEWHGAESEAVLKPQDVQARITQLSGEWATVGTGWAAYPHLLISTNATLVTTDVTLPAAEDMLPLALSAWQRGESVAVENAEPVYLRNEVAWKSYQADKHHATIP